MQTEKMHPVYAKIFESGERYLDTADAAKCLRSTLAKRWPATKFSVKISRYSGGSSVRVSWVDGPTYDMVNDVASGFEGKGFDGMIDLAYYKDIFLMPDGSAEFAGTDGTQGSMGMVEAASRWKPAPEALRVSSSCYVFCERNYSAAMLQRNLEAYARKFHDDLSEAIKAGAVRVVVTNYGAHVEGAGQIRAESGEWADQVLNRHLAKRMVAQAA